MDGGGDQNCRNGNRSRGAVICNDMRGGAERAVCVREVARRMAVCDLDGAAQQYQCNAKCAEQKTHGTAALVQAASEAVAGRILAETNHAYP